MKSKMSFCNSSVFKRFVFRGLPLWGAYLLLWLVMMPLPLLSNGGYQDQSDMQQYILGMASNASTWMSFFYALAVACMVSSYLYKSRSANFFGALPVKRQTMFTTQYLAGLSFSVVPNFVIMILTMLAGFYWGFDLVKEAAIWFASQFLGFMFFYGFATLIAMIVGNLIALPLIYGVLNFTVVVIEEIVRALLDVFVHGAWMTADVSLAWASPLIYMMGFGNMGVRYTVDGSYFYGWNVLGIYALVGVAFTVLAFFLHKNRAMESAGDVIAVRRLKPVFLYCFTIGCSLCIGYFLAAVVFGSISENAFGVVLLCMLIGAFIGYFVGQMMLHRTVRVFRSRYFANYGVVALVILAVMLCVRFDLFGYSRYVPDVNEVEAVSLGHDDERFSTDPELIEKTVRLHRELIKTSEDSSYYEILLTYRLKNGKIIHRSYDVNYDRALYHEYEAMYTDPEYVVVRRLGGDYTAQDIAYCNIYDEKGNQIYLAPDEAYLFLKTCLEPDLQESSMRTDDGGCGIYIEICYAENADLFDYRYNHFAVTADATRILAFTAQQGIEPIY